ncbi:MAG: cation transporter [Candidatus Korarchaeota archaeon]|nr:cation transporter [Candidatus Korarchaeota archaeon]
MDGRTEKVAIASVLISVAIVAVKLFVAAVTGSMVVLAEFLDSLGDVLTSSITWIGVRLSRRPPDADHPYGHAKFDSLLGLLSAFVLLEVEAYVIYKGIISLLGPLKPPTVTDEVLFLLVGTSVVNAGRSIALWMTGGSEGSRIMQSEAVNYGWDAARTLVVAGVLILASEAPWIDPLAALVATTIILPSTVRVVYWSASDLLDRIDPKLLARIRSVLDSCREIKSVRRVRARRVGNSLLVDAVVEVDPSLTAERTQDILRKVEERLKMEVGAADVTIAVFASEGEGDRSEGGPLRGVLRGGGRETSPPPSLGGGDGPEEG